MKTSLRLALLACAGCVALAFAGPALAKYNPSLTIEQTSYRLGASFTMDIFLAASEDDDPSAKLTIFSPAGYSAQLSAAPGTKVGSAVAVAKIAALGGASLPLAGDVVVANPADPNLIAASTRCRGSATNQAVLVLNLALQGQSPTPFPVFVNQAGPFVTFEICAPHPDVSPTNPSGVRILLLDATLKGLFRNASSRGGYEWATVFTPYGPSKVPNPAGSLEWRTYVGLPSTLTLTKAKAKRGFKLVGKLTVAGLNPKGIRLGLYSGRKQKPAPTALTSGTGKRTARSAALPTTGRYSMARSNVKFTTYFQTRFENYLTDCTGPSPSGLPVPCSGEFLASTTSNQVKATKPRPKKRR